MNITKVKFERLVSTGNFSNMTVGVEAEVGAEESPVKALHNIECFVLAEISARENRARAAEENAYEERAVSDQIGQLQSELKRLQDRRDRAKSFLEQHGVSTQDWDDSDPFADC